MDLHRTSPLFQYLSSDNNLHEIRNLLDSGVNPNIQSYGGFTPLHVAINSRVENIEIIRALIIAGADVNMTNHLGFTCLHSAVAFQHHQVIDILIQSGASVNAKTFLGTTPLHFAVTGNNIVQSPDTWVIDRLLNHEDIDYNVTDYRGDTPLMMAVKYLEDHAALRLLQKNANPNICNELSQTPLHVAFSGPEGDMEDHLMLSGASVYSVDSTGQTPVDILLKNDRPSIFDTTDPLKLIVFKYNITDDLKRKLECDPELSHFLNKCCEEVDLMHRDVISGNITVHDFVCNCFNEDQFENILLQIYKPLIDRLVNDIYPNYFADILNNIPDDILLAILEMTAISRIHSQRGEMMDIVYLFSNLGIVTLVNEYLSHLDIISLIVAFSDVKNPESFHDVQVRVPMCLV